MNVQLSPSLQMAINAADIFDKLRARGQIISRINNRIDELFDNTNDYRVGGNNASVVRAQISTIELF